MTEMAPRGESAAAAKQQAAAARADAARRVADIKRRQAEAARDLEARRKAMEAEFARQRAELDAQMTPLQAELAKLTEVAWTVDLYLGRDEDLTLLRDGAPAPADTPITIRQKVLVMAEESLVLLGKKPTGMDAEDIDEFVRWLLAAPENLDRVLPEPKGVVVLIPTRVPAHSGNIFEDAHRNAANQRSWWLLRNGDRLYLLTVDPALRVIDRILPRRSEFTEVFDQRLFGFGRRIGDPVEPGSEEWLRLEAQADARRRHYMRIMLVLQGIVDRTPVWAPLPAGGVNLLSVDTQDDGRVRLIQDAEDSIQLGDGREPFAAWQKRLNALMRPGLRIVGDWSAYDFADLYIAGDRWHRGYHPRLSPGTVESRPETGVPHLIEDRRDGGFVIRFHRTERVYRRNVPVPDKPGYVYRGEYPVEATKRASCVVKPTDGWVLPFDLATEAELSYYLNSREERSEHFLSLVPVLRSALKAKRDEAEQERPFRQLLGDLLRAEGAEDAAVKELVDELVTWWKAAHTYARPLNGDSTHEKKAAEQILDRYRHGAADEGKVRQMVTAARRHLPDAMCVAHTKNGQWRAYVPSPNAHDPHVFCDITTLHADGSPASTKLWQTVPQRSATALHVAWSDDRWDNWEFTASPRHYLTGPERDRLYREITEQTDGIVLCITDFHDPAQPAHRQLTVYAWTAGTPETAPVRATSSPLGWRDESKDALVTAHRYETSKDSAGARLGPAIPASHAHFGHFSVPGSRWGDLPWWPDTATRYGGDRARLAWADEAALDRLGAYVERCKAAAKAEQDQRRLREAKAYRHSNPIMRLIRARCETEIRARFIEDYGPDADDLWPAHLKSLPARALDPIHPRTVWALVERSLAHEAPVTGRTLAELADFARLGPNGVTESELDLFGDIVAPEPDPEPADPEP